MNLPNFLVIGAPRSGTTWLHQILTTHPEIWMPSDRKEVHFFDANWERGVEWYQELFANAHGAAIGETTPAYLIRPEVPERIAVTLPHCRLIAILRDPVQRLYSNYGRYLTTHAEDISFEDFIEKKPTFVEVGRYAQHLNRYFSRFGAERIHVVILERATADPTQTFAKIGEFLGLGPVGFNVDSEPRNATRNPILSQPYLWAWKAAQRLRALGFHRIVKYAKKAGLPDLFGEGKRMSMKEATRERLEELYEPEVRRLEHLLGSDIPEWRRERK